MPNTGIKGFPFLSGLVAFVELMALFFHLKKIKAKIKLPKKQYFTVSRKVLKNKAVTFEKDIKLNPFLSVFSALKMYI